MAAAQDTDGTARAERAGTLGWLGFATLTVVVLTDRFAEVPAVLAAYAGALYLLAGD